MLTINVIVVTTVIRYFKGGQMYTLSFDYPRCHVIILKLIIIVLLIITDLTWNFANESA